MANLASGDDAIKAALAKAGAMEPLLWRSCATATLKARPKANAA